MTLSMARKFAFQNLRANRVVVLPFVVANSIMLTLFNVMVGLLANDYVQTRHETLPMLIGFGVVVIGIFALIFVLYTTGFLLKRRNREFALYGILGLEKKHIRKIIRIEFLVLFSIIGGIALVGGYLFGQLSFLALNRLINEVTGRLMDYPFSIFAMFLTIGLVVGLYFITVLRSGFRIQLSTPMELLGRQHRGEGEPKSRVVLMCLGFIFLAGGYGLALTVEGMLSSLLYFFFAALLVLIATYLLFISFSVIFLKAQKKTESYYTPAKFLRVNGLLYRMKSNAVSLASISILSVGVIITLSATATIYANIESMAQNALPRDYHIRSDEQVDNHNVEKVAETLRALVDTTVNEQGRLADDYVSYSMMTAGIREGSVFMSGIDNTNIAPTYILVYDLDGYNARTHQKIMLQENEVLLCTNVVTEPRLASVTIGDRTFRATAIDNIIPSTFAAEAYGLVVKDIRTMQYIGNVLKTMHWETKQPESAPIFGQMDWNVEGVSDTEYAEKVHALQGEDERYTVRIRTEYIDSIYELNGGFLFLGIVIGLIFLTGAVLITYYKQVNEGYEDREKIQIMKKVGLSDRLIKKTCSSQIGWMFYAPLVVAIFHCAVASKIIYQLLGLFAVRHFAQYGLYFGMVVAAFVTVYFVLFRLTSRTYYKIVQ